MRKGARKHFGDSTVGGGVMNALEKIVEEMRQKLEELTGEEIEVM